MSEFRSVEIEAVSAAYAIAQMEVEDPNTHHAARLKCRIIARLLWSGLGEPGEPALTPELRKLAESMQEGYLRAATFGEFRVCWRHGSGPALAAYGTPPWNESAATKVACDYADGLNYGVGNTGNPSTTWVEHQDPTTKMWKPW